MKKKKYFVIAVCLGLLLTAMGYILTFAEEASVDGSAEAGLEYIETPATGLQDGGFDAGLQLRALGEGSDDVQLFGDIDLAGLEQELVAAWTNKEEKINVEKYNISKSEIDTIAAAYIGILSVHPEFFYVKGLKSYSVNYKNTIIELTQQFDNENYSNEDIAKFRQNVRIALSQILKPGMSDLDKVLATHEYIVLNCEYAPIPSDIDTKTIAAADPQYFNAYGVIVDGVAVCQGYAQAMKMLLRYEGIDSIIATSKAMNHAWNLVKLDGEWYHVDATMDDPTTKTTLGMAGFSGKGHFLLSDDTIKIGKAKVREAHYGWDSGGVTCTSEKYESGYAFNTSKTPMYYIDGLFWYVDGNYKLVRSKANKNNLTQILGLSASYPYTEYIKYLQFDGKNLYYIYPGMTLYSYDTSAGKNKSLAKSVGEIETNYGLGLKDGKLIWYNDTTEQSLDVSAYNEAVLFGTPVLQENGVYTADFDLSAIGEAGNELIVSVKNNRATTTAAKLWAADYASGKQYINAVDPYSLSLNGWGETVLTLENLGNAPSSSNAVKRKCFALTGDGKYQPVSEALVIE